MGENKEGQTHKQRRGFLGRIFRGRHNPAPSQAPQPPAEQMGIDAAQERIAKQRGIMEGKRAKYTRNEKWYGPETAKARARREVEGPNPASANTPTRESQPPRYHDSQGDRGLGAPAIKMDTERAKEIKAQAEKARLQTAHGAGYDATPGEVRQFQEKTASGLKTEWEEELAAKQPVSEKPWQEEANVIQGGRQEKDSGGAVTIAERAAANKTEA